MIQLTWHLNGVQGVKVTRPSLLYMLSPAELTSTALVSVLVSVGRGRMLKKSQAVCRLRVAF